MCPLLSSMKRWMLCLRLLVLRSNIYAFEGLHTHRAIMLSLLGAFLFVDGSKDKALATLLTVVDGIHHGNTPTPLMLAETILGPGRLCNHLDQFFSKSPLLLQVETVIQWPSFPPFFLFSSMIYSFGRKPGRVFYRNYFVACSVLLSFFFSLFCCLVLD